MQDKLIIGLHGKARSGKDTLANYLKRQYGFTNMAYADTPKLMLKHIYNFHSDQLWGDTKEEVDPRYGRSPRYIMQYILSAFRETWPDVWIYHLYHKLLVEHNKQVVVTDVRLINEVEGIKKWGGYAVKIQRDHAGASNGIENHVSEVELDGYQDWDLIIQNNGSVEEMCQQIDEPISKWRKS